MIISSSRSHHPVVRRIKMCHKFYFKSTGLAIAAIVALIALYPATHALAGSPVARVFDTPQDAVSALVGAARKKDTEAILDILGPETREWIISGDPVQDDEGRANFVAAYDQKHNIELESDDMAVLVIGDDDFPFPFPVVKLSTGWVFDAEEGKEELLDRRIGENELNAIQVLLAIADAQNEYSTVDRDGDGLVEYASRFGSTEGMRDGLYWPAEGDEPLSPLGPLVAEAAQEGYTARGGSAGDETVAPYHGYRFRLLSRQGAAAPDGAYDYVVGDNNIGGFAALAYPENYGVSGIMTLMVSHDGLVYQADLGPETQTEASAIEEFNPGDGWKEVAPQ
jgi:hypothetical protein